MKKHILITIAILMVFATSCDRDLLPKDDYILNDNGLLSDSVSSKHQTPDYILNDKGPLFDPGTRYVLYGTKWNKNSFTYYLINSASSLTAQECESIIQTAFQRWAEFTNLTFTKASSPLFADFKLQWVSEGTNHGCGNSNIFDSSDLAHASFPGASQAGLICFNNNKTWIKEDKVNPGSAERILLHTAMHEIGHALGLSESNVTNQTDAIMWPAYTGMTTLRADDLLGIRQLYGLKLNPITGNGSVCLNNSVTLTSPYPQGQYTWTWSGNLNKTSESGNQATFKGISNGAGWVAINMFDVNQNAFVEITRKPVWVGAPGLTSIYPEGGYDGYYNFWTSANSDISQVNWIAAGFDDYGNQVSGTVISSSCSGNHGYVNIKFNTPGTYTISAYATNSCGTGNSISFYNFPVYFYKMIFNPISNEIEISVDDGNASKSAGAASKDKFTVTILDSNNTARTQNNFSGKSFNLSASSLSDGIYDIRITNGTITETKQLVIKR